MSTINGDMIRIKIEQVQRGEKTIEEVTDIIVDWCGEAIEDEQDCVEQYEEEEKARQSAMIHAAFTTGVPDLFSDEMRLFWNAE